MKKGRSNYGFFLISLFALMFLITMMFNTNNRVENLNYTQLIHTLKTKDIQSIQINKDAGVLVVEGSIKISDDPKAVFTEQKFKAFVPDTPEQYLQLINIANDNNADLMIRIHSDSSVNPDVHGASMLVPGDVGYASDIVDISNEYGKIILDTLVSEVGMSNRGVITRTDQTGFNWSKIPIMTVEMGFMSNPDEDQLLSTTEYQEKLANALYLGIDRCFSESNTINE